MAKGKTVLICSKLPHSLILRNPLKPAVTVELLGMNSSKIVGATFVMTEIDAEFWEVWKAAHDHETQAYEPLKTGAIFESTSPADAKAIAKEYKDRRTGLEPLRTDGKDQRAAGVKTVPKNDNDDE